MTRTKKNTSHSSVIRTGATVLATALVVIVALLMPSGLRAELTPDAPKYKVKLFKSFLSVNAQDAAFGDIMAEVASKVGFELVISPDIAEKTLTTGFNDVEVQRAIQRLMALINHKNYFMHYGREGNIKKLEIYGSVSPSTVRSLPTPSAPGDAQPSTGPMMPREAMPEDGSAMPPGMQLGDIAAPQGAVVSIAPESQGQPKMTAQMQPDAAPATEAKLMPEAVVKYPYLKPAQMPEQLPEIKRL